MLKQMLFTQWKWSKLELGVFAVIAFAVPTLVMKTVTMAAGRAGTTVSIQALLSASTALGVALAFVAMLCAVTLAVRPWLVDHSRQHVMALSLPLRWADFVRLRFLAGAALLVVPAIAVWLGAILAAFSLPVPATLHVYPTSIAVRFYAAALVLYAMAFAFQYLAGRRAAVAAAGFIALLLVAEVTMQITGRGFAVPFWEFITSWPGPLEVLTARWMLIDV